MVFYFTLLERLFPVLSGFTTTETLASQNSHGYVKVVDSKLAFRLKLLVLYNIINEQFPQPMAWLQILTENISNCRLEG
jgi:hypothetical protein